MAILMLLAGSPCTLSVSTDTGSSAPGPNIPWVEFCSARALPGSCPMFPWSQSPPHLVGSPTTHQKGAYQESPKNCWLICACSSSYAPNLPYHHHVLSLICLHGTVCMGEQTAPSSNTRRKPVSLLTVPSCKLHFKKKKLIALYCSNQYAQYMLNVYEHTFLFLFFESVRSIFFSFSFYVELKRIKKNLQTQVAKTFCPSFCPFVRHLQLGYLVGQ